MEIELGGLAPLDWCIGWGLSKSLRDPSTMLRAHWGGRRKERGMPGQVISRPCNQLRSSFFRCELRSYAFESEICLFAFMLSSFVFHFPGHLSFAAAPSSSDRLFSFLVATEVGMS